MAEKGTFVQRNYKDTIFHDLFSDKKNALSLYNALNHTDYQDTEGLEVVTLSDAIYIHLKNDVSILFQDQLELWEHQSTRNGNMPLRGLLYFARATRRGCFSTTCTPGRCWGATLSGWRRWTPAAE